MFPAEDIQPDDMRQYSKLAARILRYCTRIRRLQINFGPLLDATSALRSAIIGLKYTEKLSLSRLQNVKALKDLFLKLPYTPLREVRLEFAGGGDCGDHNHVCDPLDGLSDFADSLETLWLDRLDLCETECWLPGVRTLVLPHYHESVYSSFFLSGLPDLRRLILAPRINREVYDWEYEEDQEDPSPWRALDYIQGSVAAIYVLGLNCKIHRCDFVIPPHRGLSSDDVRRMYQIMQDVRVENCSVSFDQCCIRGAMFEFLGDRACLKRKLCLSRFSVTVKIYAFDTREYSKFLVSPEQYFASHCTHTHGNRR